MDDIRNSVCLTSALDMSIECMDVEMQNVISTRQRIARIELVDVFWSIYGSAHFNLLVSISNTSMYARRSFKELIPSNWLLGAYVIADITNKYFIDIPTYRNWLKFIGFNI